MALGAGERAGRDVTGIAVGEVLVHLVGDVVHPAIAAQGVDLAERGLGKYGAARVVRRDGDDGARPIGQRAANGVDAQLIPIVGGDGDGPAAGHLNRHLVVEVERGRQDDLVAGLGDGDRRVHERQVRARGHHQAPSDIDVDAVLGAQLVRQTLDQRRQAVSVVVVVGGRAFRRRARRIDRRPRRTVVHDALSERNRARHLPDEVADDRHDGRLDVVHAGAAAGVHGLAA